MAIGRYGIESPHRCTLSDFNVKEEYLILFFRKDTKEIFVSWSRVIRSQNEVVFKILSSEDKCSSVLVSSDKRQAIIEDEVVEISIIGYHRIFKSNDLMIFGGKDDSSNRTKVYVSSSDKTETKSFDSKDQPIKVEMSYETAKFKFVRYMNESFLNTQRGGNFFEINQLSPENDTWLELGLQLENLSFFTLDVEGEVRDFNFVQN